MNASNQDQQLKQLLQERGIDMPSPDFTDRVMDRIEALPQSKPIVYKPLIGRFGWLAIVLGALGFIIAVFSTASPSAATPDLLPDFASRLPSFPELNFPNLSPTIILISVAFTLLILAERVMDRVRS